MAKYILMTDGYDAPEVVPNLRGADRAEVKDAAYQLYLNFGLPEEVAVRALLRTVLVEFREFNSQAVIDDEAMILRRKPVLQYG